jgi:hypothetical protein
LALLADASGPRLAVMPTIPLPNGKRQVNAVMLQTLMRDFKPDHVVLEVVHSMPKQGIAGAFNFGGDFRAVQTVIELNLWPLKWVTPQKWQKEIFGGMAKKNTKAAALRHCRYTWPSVCFLATERCKVPHDGLCDAACIADWGRRFFYGHSRAVQP